MILQIQERTHPDFEALIAREPEVRSHYLAYADWLQGEGEPRGELIVLNSKLQETKAQNRRLKIVEDCNALLEAHPHLDFRATTRGNIPFDPHWEMGFVQAVRPSLPVLLDQEFLTSLRAVLSHPACRFVQVLKVVVQRDTISFSPLMDELLHSGGPRTLRALHLACQRDYGSRDPGPGTVTGDVSALAEKTPSLQRVFLTRVLPAVSTWSLPDLRHLSIQADGLTPEHVEALTSHVHPRLDTLDVWLGSPQSTGLRPRHLKRILSNEHFPSLRHLTLAGFGYPNELLAEIVRSSILPQLQSLSLRDPLSPNSVLLIRGNAQAFAGLTRLDLGDAAKTLVDVLPNTVRTQAFGRGGSLRHHRIT